MLFRSFVRILVKQAIRWGEFCKGVARETGVIIKIDAYAHMVREVWREAYDLWDSLIIGKPELSPEVALISLRLRADTRRRAAKEAKNGKAKSADRSEIGMKMARTRAVEELAAHGLEYPEQDLQYLLDGVRGSKKPS